MLLNPHISAYTRCLAGKVCGLVRSTWGTSQGEDKLGARDKILNTKVARRACAGQTFPPCMETHRALCVPCATSRLFSTTGSHGSHGPEDCTPDAVLNGSCPLLWVGGFQGCSRDEHRNNGRCARAVRQRPPRVSTSCWSCCAPCSNPKVPAIPPDWRCGLDPRRP